MTKEGVAILALFVAITLCGCVQAQAVAAEAIRTGRWTKAEVNEFQSCVAELKAKKERFPGLWCEVGEEGKHWGRLHPEILHLKRDQLKFHKCTKAHAIEMNGTPQQFFAAMDRCLREEYGLPTQ
jgi:hypothetical protein